MTGFTYGTSAGATYGTSSGGTLGVASDQWRIGGLIIPNAFEEAATHQTLTLAFRVQSSVLTDRVRPLKTNDNQTTVLPRDDGGFRAIDRANGANTYQVDPPTDRHPLRRAGTYHVARYEEELVSQEVNEWNVELELVRAQNRSDEPTIDAAQQVPQTAGDGFTYGTTDGATLGNSTGGTLGGGSSDTRPRDWWGIETRHGTLYTDRVDARFLGTGAEGVPRFELVARLTFEQTHVLEASLSRIMGVRVRQIQDGDNEAVDETDGANTLTVSSPTPAVVADGDYVAVGFESERINDAYNEVSLEIAKT